MVWTLLASVVMMAAGVWCPETLALTMLSRWEGCRVCRVQLAEGQDAVGAAQRHERPMTWDTVGEPCLTILLMLCEMLCQSS